MPDEHARVFILVALGVMIAYWTGWMLGHQFGSRGLKGPVDGIRVIRLAYRAGWTRGWMDGRRSARRLLLEQLVRRIKPETEA